MIDPAIAPNLVDRLFLRVDGVQSTPSVNLYALTLAGALEHEPLKIAVAAWLAEQPLLRTRVGAGKTKRVVRSVGDSGAVLEFFDTAPPEVNFPTAAEIAFVRRPLDLVVDPPVRLAVWRHGPLTRLVMNVHHAVVDGVGGYFLLDRLAAHYSAVVNGIPADPPPLAPSRRYRDIARALPFRDRVRAVIGMGTGFLEILGPAGACTTFGTKTLPSRGEFAWRECALPPERVAAMKAWARAHGGTLNSLLLAATAVAGAATWPDRDGRRVRVMIPVSLRLGPTVDATNRVAEMPVNIPRAACVDLASAFEVAKAADVRDRGAAFAAIARHGLASFLPPGPVRKTLARSLDRPVNHAMTYVFSNTGVLDPQPRDFGPVVVLGAAGMPPLTMPPGLGIVAATTRGRLTLTLAYLEPAFAAQEIETFETALVAILQEL